MELHCSRTVLIVIITVVLTEFNSSTENTTRRLKHVFKTRNDRKTNTTTNAGNVNTMKKPNSEEWGKWKVPSTPGVTKTLISQKHLEKENISTTHISMKDTKREQNNLSYSAVTMMYSADPTNSSLATNKSTAFSHDPDNSEHIMTIVGLTVSLLVVVTVVVVGLLFLCYYNRLLCFKRKTKRDLDQSSSSMLDEEKIQTQDMTVDGDVVSMVDIPMLNEKSKAPDMSGDENTVLIVDIKTEDERYPVRTKDKPIIKSLNNIQPSDASEYNKMIKNI